ncbi:unnamed protein product, partial [Polarella glacialis]
MIRCVDVCERFSHLPAVEVALVHTFLSHLRWSRTAVANVGCVTWAELFIDFIASVQYDAAIFPLTDSMSQLTRRFSKVASFTLGPALKLKRLQVGRAFRHLRHFGLGNASGIRARHNNHAVEHVVARMVQYHCTAVAVQGPSHIVVEDAANEFADAGHLGEELLVHQAFNDQDRRIMNIGDEFLMGDIGDDHLENMERMGFMRRDDLDVSPVDMQGFEYNCAHDGCETIPEDSSLRQFSLPTVVTENGDAVPFLSATFHLGTCTLDDLRNKFTYLEQVPDEQTVLSRIDEDVDQVRHGPLDEVSPGHSSAGHSMSSGWQQQLSARLAQEKWVLSDSIRITAHAAIPVLSFITTPEEAAPYINCGKKVAEVSPESDESLSCSTRVDMCLHGSNHLGLKSKSFVNWMIKEYPCARPVTLVLKQWLIEQTYGMSHSSYGLLLMVVCFLQHCPVKTVGGALIGFLNFYGRRFEPKLYGVSVARGAFLHRKHPMSWPPEQAHLVEKGLLNTGKSEFSLLPRKLEMTGEEAHRFDPLWVEDPLNPTNNVGRNCFRIRQIQRSLARAADAMAASE